MVVKYEAFFQIWWIWCNISCDFRHFRKTHVPLGEKKMSCLGVGGWPGWPPGHWCGSQNRLDITSSGNLNSGNLGWYLLHMKNYGFFLAYWSLTMDSATSLTPRVIGLRVVVDFQWDESRSIVSTVPSIVFWGNRCSLRPMNGKIPNWTMFLHGVAETTRFLR